MNRHVRLARRLLARRSLDDPTDIAYYLCFHPATITREQVVAVAGARWAVEEGSAARMGDILTCPLRCAEGRAVYAPR
ncbi:SRSO17 transposase [Nocardia sp. GAS34]|jgi:SRSO17 transposase|uniref:hypothetical protein n=1 Tax=unclassified Nocardia TaxID=2637762 RepID=UPI003D1F8CBD